MKNFRFLLAMLIASAFLVFTPSQANAAVPFNGTIIEVTENLNGLWPVSSGVNDVDYWTGSDMRMVSKCSGKYTCLTIKSGPVNGTPRAYYHGCKNVYSGWGDKTPTSYCTITVDTRDADASGSFNYSARRWLIRHEVGHFRGLSHQSGCVSNMYQYVRCPNGKLPPNKWLTSERNRLRTR